MLQLERGGGGEGEQGPGGGLHRLRMAGTQVHSVSIAIVQSPLKGGKRGRPRGHARVRQFRRRHVAVRKPRSPDAGVSAFT